MQKLPTARDLVLAAARDAENESVKTWLLRDERGTFEQIARRFLENQEPFETHPEEAQQQAADHIRLVALTSMATRRNPSGTQP